jgi:hypothetical protein
LEAAHRSLGGLVAEGVDDHRILLVRALGRDQVAADAHGGDGDHDPSPRRVPHASVFSPTVPSM